MSEEFGVSRVTVRKALGLLEQQGLVVRRKRLGIFALRPVVELPTGTSVDDLVARTAWLARHSEVRLIRCRTVVVPGFVRLRLQLARDARVLKFERVRSDAGGTLAHLTTFLAPQAAARVTRAELIAEPPIVVLPRKGIDIAHVEQTISAELATRRMSHWLNVSPGAALIRTTRLMFDAAGTPVSYMIARLRADRYEIHYTLSQGETSPGAPTVWRIEK